MARMPGVRFVRPKSWSGGRPLGPPRFIVMHYTAGSEGPDAAEDGVAYDQRRTDGTSTHFFVDRDSIIQCVDTADRSHTALYHGNAWGVHIEQCGTLQSLAQWMDDASRKTIRNAAKAAAWAMKTHNIPLTRLIVSQVRNGKGVCGHYDCTYGFPEDHGSHTDPGGAYPYNLLFDDIRAIMAGDPLEDDMAALEEEVVIGVDIAALSGGYVEPGQKIKLGRFLQLIFSHNQRDFETGNAVKAALTILSGKVDTVSAGVVALKTVLEQAGGDPNVALILTKLEEEAAATRALATQLISDDQMKEKEHAAAMAAAWTASIEA